MRESNLFVYFHDRLRRRAEEDVESQPERPGGWENALTEATAFYLSCDRSALVKVVERVTGSGDPPGNIGTQSRGTEGTPDLAIDPVAEVLVEEEDEGLSYAASGSSQRRASSISTTGRS
jgi:hypothetical protein